MDFVKSPFGKLQLWIVKHFFLHNKVPVLMNHNIWKKLCFMMHYYRYLFVKKKVFNYSELHFSEVISYKIHTSTICAKYILFLFSTLQVYHLLAWP